ncbi:MAG TPA: LamG-like jellyroll fold domain-containing protein, partial [Gemmataceae bacterium]
DATGSATSYSTAVLASTPLDYWRLDETGGTAARNAVPGGPAGTYVGGAQPGVAGLQSTGVHFNGSTAAVTTPVSLSGLGAFSYEAWIRPTGAQPNRTGLTGQNDAIEFGFITGSTLQLWTPATGGLSVAYTKPVGQWTHVVAVGTGTQLRIYLDGQLAGTLDHAAVAGYGSSPFLFNIAGAGVFDPTGNYFNGDMDEVAVYGRALSPAEVQSHYSAGIGAPVAVSNVPPSVTAGGNVTLNTLGTFTRAGSFTDPGTDTWTATVNYGDGTGTQPLTLNADKTFSLSHNFATDGVYPVIVAVTDKDGGLGTAGFVATVNRFTVNTTLDAVADDGLLSLREALTNANSHAGTDAIAFNIPGGGVQTIQPASALPTVTDPVVIDGYTQPGSAPNTLATGGNAALLIELNGAGAGAGVRGLTITGGGSTVRGLVINRFDGAGILVQTGGGNVIAGNYVGTDAAGAAALGNGAQGVVLNGASGNTVGGTDPGARNVISGNAQGVTVNGGASG